MKKRAATFLTILAVAAMLAAQPATYEELRKEAGAAREAHDAARFLSALEQMNVLRPNHPTILVNLVAAFAMNGRPEDAIAVAERLVRMKVHFDPSRADFDPLRNDPRFAAVTAALAELRDERVAGAKIGFRIAQKGLIPEGLAWDDSTGRFFVSSARLGKIMQVDRRRRASDFVRAGVAGVHGLSGMGIDRQRRILWACSTTSARFASFHKGDPNDAALVGFDLRTGKLLRRIPLEEKESFCDDLTVAKDGTVYVSDSSGSVLLLRPVAARLETLVARGVIRSPQGSALSDDGNVLYVADYGGPIRVVDLRTHDVTPLRLPSDLQPMGMDGIALRGNHLVAVQNGIEPNRIIELTLSQDGLAVSASRILEMNHPLIDEPTIGKFAGDAYYFVGASQGNKFDAGDADPAKLTDAIVFVIPRPWRNRQR